MLEPKGPVLARGSWLNPDCTVSPWDGGLSQMSSFPRSAGPGQKPEFKPPWHFLWVVMTSKAKSQSPYWHVTAAEGE